MNKLTQKISKFANTLLVVCFFFPGTLIAAAPLAHAETISYNEEAIKHFNKGHELQNSGFLNQAITEYQAAIAAEPRLEEAFSNLGILYTRQKSYNKAGESFQKALALRPDRPTSMNGYGTVLYARGKSEEAKQLWKKAISLDPKFGAAYFNLGNALENEHKPLEAIEQYAKAISIDPNDGDAFYRIGVLYQKSQHQAQARVMFAKAILLGRDAEYIRDAKKQLAQLDAAFAKDSKSSNSSKVES